MNDFYHSDEYRGFNVRVILSFLTEFEKSNLKEFWKYCDKHNWVFIKRVGFMFMVNYDRKIETNGIECIQSKLIEVKDYDKKVGRSTSIDNILDDNNEDI